MNPSVRGRESVLLSMDAHSIWHDTSILGIEIKESSGQNVTRQWIVDPLAVIQSHQHLAVLFASLWYQPRPLDSFPRWPRVLSFPKIISDLLLSFFLSLFLSLCLFPVSSLFPNLAPGGILLVINFAKVTLITPEFYLSRLASTSQSRTPANFFSSSFVFFLRPFALLYRRKTRQWERLRWARVVTNHI